MPTAATASPAFAQRADRLVSELHHAFRAVDASDQLDWAADLAKVTGHVAVRRCVRLATTVRAIGSGLADESVAAWEAAMSGRLLDHLGKRGEAAADSAKKFAMRSREQAAHLAALSRTPEGLADVVVTVAAAWVTSGGVDADGGLPDVDITFGGIDAHRSIFTHSIISGTLVEASLYGIATMMRLAHSRLPSDHDPVWDAIDRHRDTIITRITQGMSAGLAYHLLVDGLIQEGTYHGLPFAMPQEGHDAVAAVNGLAEGHDVSAKQKTFTPKRPVDRS